MFHFELRNYYNSNQNGLLNVIKNVKTKIVIKLISPVLSNLNRNCLHSVPNFLYESN